MNVGGGSGSAREALAAERRRRGSGWRLGARRGSGWPSGRRRGSGWPPSGRRRGSGWPVWSASSPASSQAADSANTDDEHDPEGATIAFERQHVVALIGQARDQLAAIDAALRRLDEGGYGQCERCGQPIAPERLAARPTATRCVSCAGKR